MAMTALSEGGARSFNSDGWAIPELSGFVEENWSKISCQIPKPSTTIATPMIRPRTIDSRTESSWLA